MDADYPLYALAEGIIDACYNGKPTINHVKPS